MEVPLTALDARNPLAFLAALGTLRLASAASDTAALFWRKQEGLWSATFADRKIASEDELIAAIIDAHESRDLTAELGWERDVMKLTRDDVRRILGTRLSDDANAWQAATVAACVGELPERSGGDAPYTPFRVIPRMGRAGFLETALKSSEPNRLADALREALFGKWSYVKGTNSLRWDPGAPLPARAYASEAPSHFRPHGVPGAMLLSVAALPLFPLMPLRRSVACCGFGRDRGALFWPVWTEPMQLGAARLLLGLPAIYESRPDTRGLARHGVATRMVARRARFGPDAEVLSWGKESALETPPRPDP